MFIQTGEIDELFLGILWLEFILICLFAVYHEKRFSQIFPALGIFSALIFDLVLINYLYLYQNMIWPYLFFIIMGIVVTAFWPLFMILKINDRKIALKTDNSE